MYKCASYDLQLLSSINNMYQSGELCDIIIMCEDISFECHKMILAASSQYFKQTFMTRLNETNIWDISFLDTSTLRLLITYMYTGKCLLTQDTFVVVFLSALRLNMSSLVELCCQHVRDVMDIRQLVIQFEAILNTKHEELVRNVVIQMQTHLEEVLTVPELSNLTMRSMKLIFHEEKGKPDLRMKIVMKWIEANTNTEGVNEMIEIIRFEELSMKYLCEIQDHSLMQHTPQIHLVKAALAHHLSRTQSEEAASTSASSVTSSRILPPLLLSLSHTDVGVTHDPQALVTINLDNQICIYDWETLVWKVVMKNLSWMDGYSGTCSYEQGLIVYGSEDQETTTNVCLINITNKQIHKLPDLPVPIQEAGKTEA